MRKRTRYQSVLVTVPNGTGANTTSEATLALDRAYRRCVGVAVHLVNAGGVTNGYFRVGIKDQTRTYHDLSHISNWAAGPEVPPNYKFKDLEIPVKDGELVSVLVNNPSATSADLVIEVVFKLVDDLVEEPRT